MPKGERLDVSVLRTASSSIEGLLAAPDSCDIGFFEPAEHPSEGKMLTMAIPVAFSSSPGDGFRLPPPRLGEHTRAVLGELGYSDTDIDEITA